MINKTTMQEKNTERMTFQDFNVCPNILHVEPDVNDDAEAYTRV